MIHPLVGCSGSCVVGCKIMITGTSKTALSAASVALQTKPFRVAGGAALAVAVAFASVPAAAQTVDPVQAPVFCAQQVGGTEFACGNGSTTVGSGGRATAVGVNATATG